MILGLKPFKRPFVIFFIFNSSGSNLNIRFKCDCIYVMKKHINANRGLVIRPTVAKRSLKWFMYDEVSSRDDS